MKNNIGKKIILISIILFIFTTCCYLGCLYYKKYFTYNRIEISLCNKKGDIFANPEPAFFHNLFKIINELYFIKGIDRSKVCSLFTYCRMLEKDNNIGDSFFDRDSEKIIEALAPIREEIIEKKLMGYLVSPDFRCIRIHAQLVKTDYNDIRSYFYAFKSKIEGNIETFNSIKNTILTYNSEDFDINIQFYSNEILKLSLSKGDINKKYKLIDNEFIYAIICGVLGGLMVLPIMLLIRKKEKCPKCDKNTLLSFKFLSKNKNCSSCNYSVVIQKKGKAKNNKTDIIDEMSFDELMEVAREGCWRGVDSSTLDLSVQALRRAAKIAESNNDVTKQLFVSSLYNSFKQKGLIR